MYTSPRQTRARRRHRIIGGLTAGFRHKEAPCTPLCWVFALVGSVCCELVGHELEFVCLLSVWPGSETSFDRVKFAPLPCLANFAHTALKRPFSLSFFWGPSGVQETPEATKLVGVDLAFPFPLVAPLLLRNLMPPQLLFVFWNASPCEFPPPPPPMRAAVLQSEAHPLGAPTGGGCANRVGRDT